MKVHGRWAAPHLAAAPLALALLGATACTIVSNFDVHECSTTTDCELPTMAPTHCERSQCVAGCESNAQCVRHDPRAPLCERPGGSCVPLLDEHADCTLVAGYDEEKLGALTLQDIDIVAAFAPGPRTSTSLSIELAANELSATTADMSARPLMTLICNDSPDKTADAIGHVINNLKAVATLAPGRGRALRVLLERADFLSPSFVLGAGGADASRESESDRLWYLGPDYTSATPIYEQILPIAIAAASSRSTPAALRIQSVVGDDPEDEALASAVYELLSVNGRDVRALTLADKFAETRLQGTPEAGLENLSFDAPGLVLFFCGTREAPRLATTARLIELIETKAEADSSPPPLYILGPRLHEDPSLHALVADRASLRSRIIGVRLDPPSDPELVGALRRRFHEAYPRAAMSGLDAMPTAYDGAYAISLALEAGRQGDSAMTAADVRLGFARVTDATFGTSIPVGPGPELIESALLAARTDRRFLLVGASGPIELDQRAHTRLGVPRVYGFAADGLPVDSVFEAVFENVASDD